MKIQIVESGEVVETTRLRGQRLIEAGQATVIEDGGVVGSIGKRPDASEPGEQLPPADLPPANEPPGEQ